MDDRRCEPAQLAQEDDPASTGLDLYDPCEIDPPAQMLARLGVAVAIVFGLALLARPLLRLVH